MDRELKVAIAFAQLELLELEHGRRPLTACPGVEQVAKAIAEAKEKFSRLPRGTCGACKTMYQPDGQCACPPF